jgi:hypothetical protein
MAFQIMAKVFRVPSNDHESNEQLTNVRSCGNMSPTTLISFVDGWHTSGTLVGCRL